MLYVYPTEHYIDLIAQFEARLHVAAALNEKIQAIIATETHSAVVAQRFARENDSAAVAFAQELVSIQKSFAANEKLRDMLKSSLASVIDRWSDVIPDADSQAITLSESQERVLRESAHGIYWERWGMRDRNMGLRFWYEGNFQRADFLYYGAEGPAASVKALAAKGLLDTTNEGVGYYANVTYYYITRLGMAWVEAHPLKEGD